MHQALYAVIRIESRIKGSTYVPDCIRENGNEHTPNGGVHNQAKNQELVDACAAGHKPAGGTVPSGERRGTIHLFQPSRADQKSGLEKCQH